MLVEMLANPAHNPPTISGTRTSDRKPGRRRSGQSPQRPIEHRSMRYLDLLGSNRHMNVVEPVTTPKKDTFGLPYTRKTGSLSI